MPRPARPPRAPRPPVGRGLAAAVLAVACGLHAGAVRAGAEGPATPAAAPLAAGGCHFDTPADARAAACQRLLARSINFGNMLDHAREGLAGPALRDEFVALAAQAGFTAIRLPVRWDARAALQAPYRIDPVFFERVDGVVRLALAHGLAIVLDMHHYPSMMQEPDAEQDRFVALWAQIAAHYRDAPPAVMFELLNEPHGALTRARWNQALAAVLPVVRAQHPRRMVIVGGGDWNHGAALDDLVLPPDDRDLIATFHFYDPMPVTHQGAEWVPGAGAWLGSTWRGTAAEQAAMAARFDAVQRWAVRTQRPVWLGEFGVYHRADEATRVAWTRAVRQQAEARGFAWAYWELASSFGLLDPLSMTWRRPLLQALQPAP